MEEAIRYAGRGVREGAVARRRPLALQLQLNAWLDGLQRQSPPSILDLDAGKGEAVLQRSGHLQREKTRVSKGTAAATVCVEY